MKTINTISDTLGYTLDTYSTFSATKAIAEQDWADDTELDQAAYVADLANHQADLLNNYADDVARSFTCTGSYSPSEYNFATDNSELLIELDDYKLMDYINKHKPEFEQYLRDNFTSYDGFMSFVPNDWAEFSAELYTELYVEDKIKADRNWAIMLGWYMHRELLTDEEYTEEMYDGLSELAYGNAKNLAEQEYICLRCHSYLQASPARD